MVVCLHRWYCGGRVKGLLVDTQESWASSEMSKHKKPPVSLTLRVLLINFNLGVRVTLENNSPVEDG